MPLAGLIIASDDRYGSTAAIPALLMVAGQTLVEYQVRTVRSAGAEHIVVLINHIPAALVAAFDRLRADGIDIDIARDARDAADRIHPSEALLVLANGVAAPRAVVAAIATSPTPLILTTADQPEHDQHERIDAQSRWTGIALVDGKLLRQTAALLGDWAMGPTLLRTAVQAGTPQQRLATDHMVWLLRDDKEAAAFSHALAKKLPADRSDWVTTTIVHPIATRITPHLFAHSVPFDLVIAFPVVLLGVALLMAAIGWTALGFGTVLVATLPAATASVMTTIAARDAARLRWFDRLKLPVTCGMLAAAGWPAHAGAEQWSALVIALWAASLLLLMDRNRPPKRWYASAESVAAVMLVAVLASFPLAGLVAVTVHALASRVAERAAATVERAII